MVQARSPYSYRSLAAGGGPKVNLLEIEKKYLSESVFFCNVNNIFKLKVKKYKLY
jgi:hypothetical protein